MSNLVEYLREEAISDCVAYTEFMLQYKKGMDSLYCFFEGFEDRTYYSIRINNLSNVEDYNDYVCGGKDDVLKVHNLIKENSHYKEVKTGFFVDGDFDEGPVPDTIYVTPTYSIENFYCSQESFEKIIVAEFKMKKIDNDFAKCVDNYLELQKQFNAKTLNLNAWLACQADYRNKNKGTSRLNIDKTVKSFFEKIVSPDLTAIKPLVEIQTKQQLEVIFPKAQIIDDLEFEKKVSDFRKVNQTEKFRGKFLLKFLENYLTRLQSIFGLSSSLFENKYSCSLRFEYATICSTLSQYAKTTNCLKEYIKKIQL